MTMKQVVTENYKKTGSVFMTSTYIQNIYTLDEWVEKLNITEEDISASRQGVINPKYRAVRIRIQKYVMKVANEIRRENASNIR